MLLLRLLHAAAAARSAVTIEFEHALLDYESPHFALAANSTLHLDSLTLTGRNNTLPGGGVSIVRIDDGPPKFSANNVLFSE